MFILYVLEIDNKFQTIRNILNIRVVVLHLTNIDYKENLSTRSMVLEAKGRTLIVQDILDALRGMGFNIRSFKATDQNKSSQISYWKRKEYALSFH